MASHDNESGKPYREDLEAARYRVNTLEAELREKEAALEARNAAVDELHKRLEHVEDGDRSRRPMWPWVVGVAVVALGGVALAVLLSQKDPAPASSAPPRTSAKVAASASPSGRTYLWRGQPLRNGLDREKHPPTVADTNGDGVPDVVGMVTTVGTEGRAFAGAFDGKTGDPLWLSEELAWVPEGTASALMTTSGGTVIATTTKGELLAIDQRNGQTFERVTIGTADEICHADSSVIVVGKDGRARRWDPARRAFAVSDARCPDFHERRRRKRRESESAIPTPKADGFQIVERVIHDGRAYALVAAGRMKQPEVIAYDPSSRAVAWRAPATGDREKLAKPPFNVAFGATDGCVYVELQHATLSAKGLTGTKDHRLNCLSTNDGKLEWSVPPPFTDGMTADFITAPGRIFWLRGDRLDIVDSTTGHGIAHIGWH